MVVVVVFAKVKRGNARELRVNLKPFSFIKYEEQRAPRIFKGTRAPPASGE